MQSPSLPVHWLTRGFLSLSALAVVAISQAGCAGASQSAHADAEPSATAAAGSSTTTAGTATTPASVTSAASTSTPPASVPSAQITGLEYKAADDMIQGCVWVSQDNQQVVCVDHVVDMGAVTSQWYFLDLKNNAVTARYTVYDGMQDDKGLKADELTRVNEQLKLGAFRETESLQSHTLPYSKQPVRGKGGLGQVRWGGIYPVKLPPLTKQPLSAEGKQTVQCCRWRADAITKVSGYLAIQLRISCKFTGAPEKKNDACYIQDYNDESMPHDVAHLAVKLK